MGQPSRTVHRVLLCTSVHLYQVKAAIAVAPSQLHLCTRTSSGFVQHGGPCLPLDWNHPGTNLQPWAGHWGTPPQPIMTVFVGHHCKPGNQHMEGSHSPPTTCTRRQWVGEMYVHQPLLGCTLFPNCMCSGNSLCSQCATAHTALARDPWPTNLTMCSVQPPPGVSDNFFRK